MLTVMDSFPLKLFVILLVAVLKSGRWGNTLVKAQSFSHNYKSDSGSQTQRNL